MIAVGQKSLAANGCSFSLFGIYTVYSSLLLALGKGAAGFFLGASDRESVLFPLSYSSRWLWGMNDVLYAQPIADAVTAMITVFMATRLHKELAAAEVRTPKISN